MDEPAVGDVRIFVGHDGMPSMMVSVFDMCLRCMRRAASWRCTKCNLPTSDGCAMVVEDEVLLARYQCVMPDCAIESGEVGIDQVANESLVSTLTMMQYVPEGEKHAEALVVKHMSTKNRPVKGDTQACLTNRGIPRKH